MEGTPVICETIQLPMTTVHDSVLPFCSLNDLELLDFIVNDGYVQNSSAFSLYFNPSCESDHYSRVNDPDLGLQDVFEYFESNYYESSDLANLFNKEPERFGNHKIISQNIRSLGKNFEEFYLEISDCKFDIIALSETWTSDDSIQLYGNYENFQGVFNNRNGHGGGVGFCN